MNIQTDHKIKENHVSFMFLETWQLAKKSSKHQSWNHEIQSMPKKQSAFGPIYALSKNYLRTLRKYPENRLKREVVSENCILFVYRIGLCLKPTLTHAVPQPDFMHGNLQVHRELSSKESQPFYK